MDWTNEENEREVAFTGHDLLGRPGTLPPHIRKKYVERLKAGGSFLQVDTDHYDAICRDPDFWTDAGPGLVQWT